MNVLTMTLDEIKSLEHITYTEDDYNIYVTPDYGYYLEIEDQPVNKISFVTIEMLKQDRYSQIWVKCVFDPSIGMENVDTSTHIIDFINEQINASTLS